jgi:hypothetical protein
MGNALRSSVAALREKHRESERAEAARLEQRRVEERCVCVGGWVCGWVGVCECVGVGGGVGVGGWVCGCGGWAEERCVGVGCGCISILLFTC